MRSITLFATCRNFVLCSLMRNGVCAMHKMILTFCVVKRCCALRAQTQTKKHPIGCVAIIFINYCLLFIGWILCARQLCQPLRVVVAKLPVLETSQLKTTVAWFLLLRRTCVSAYYSLLPKQKPALLDWFLFWWERVDSNHRSQRQQIYSLPPLATREHSHIKFSL